jgi:hypothetical protein
MLAFALSLVSAPAVAAPQLVRARSYRDLEARYRSSRGVAGGGLFLLGVGQLAASIGSFNGQPGPMLIGGGLALTGETMALLGSFASVRALNGLGANASGAWGAIGAIGFVGALALAPVSPTASALLSIASIGGACAFYGYVGHVHRRWTADEASLEVPRGTWTIAPAFAMAGTHAAPGIGVYATL